MPLDIPAFKGWRCCARGNRDNALNILGLSSKKSLLRAYENIWKPFVLFWRPYYTPLNPYFLGGTLRRGWLISHKKWRKHHQIDLCLCDQQSVSVDFRRNRCVQSTSCDVFEAEFPWRQIWRKIYCDLLCMSQKIMRLQKCIVFYLKWSMSGGCKRMIDFETCTHITWTKRVTNNKSTCESCLAPNFSQKCREGQCGLIKWQAYGFQNLLVKAGYFWWGVAFVGAIIGED